MKRDEFAGNPLRLQQYLPVENRRRKRARCEVCTSRKGTALDHRLPAGPREAQDDVQSYELDTGFRAPKGVGKGAACRLQHGTAVRVVGVALEIELAAGSDFGARDQQPLKALEAPERLDLALGVHRDQGIDISPNISRLNAKLYRLEQCVRRGVGTGYDGCPLSAHRRSSIRR